MEHPYKNQTKAKAQLAVNNFVLFGELINGTVHFTDSGIIVERTDKTITVRHTNDDREDDVIEYELDKIVIYRDTAWPDTDHDESEE